MIRPVIAPSLAPHQCSVHGHPGAALPPAAAPALALFKIPLGGRGGQTAPRSATAARTTITNESRR